MMRTPLLALALVFSLVAGSVGCTDAEERAAGAATPGTEGTEQEHTELALRMMHLQRWTHKTALSLEARNGELATFYLHELEETVEGIQDDVTTYEGHDVARLTEEMLVPQVEALDVALDERNWDAVDQRVQDLATSCNQCHETTEHGFVEVDLQNLSNPYAQRFEPASP